MYIFEQFLFFLNFYLNNFSYYEIRIKMHKLSNLHITMYNFYRIFIENTLIFNLKVCLTLIAKKNIVDKNNKILEALCTVCAL